MSKHSPIIYSILWLIYLNVIISRLSIRSSAFYSPVYLKANGHFYIISSTTAPRSKGDNVLSLSESLTLSLKDT